MRIKDATPIVCDTETTGTDPAQHELLEVAAVAVRDWRNAGMFSELVRPERGIPSEASAVHGLTIADVRNADEAPYVRARLERFMARFENPVFVAFNAEFDDAFLKIEGVPKLCAMRLAKHLFKGLSSYSNANLRYARDLDVDTLGIPTHRALADAIITAALLKDELSCSEFESTGIDTIEDLIALAESPAELTAWDFGQYRGEPIGVAPRSYIDWCLNKHKDLSRDMRHTLELRLKNAA